MKILLEIMKISDRILQIIESQNISVRAFEGKIGCSYGTIAKCIAKKTDISSAWLTNIMENFPYINAEWLLTGKGTMYKESSQTENKAQNNEIDEIKTLINSLQQRINQLEQGNKK